LIPSYFEKVLFSESVKKLGQKKMKKCVETNIDKKKDKKNEKNLI
jgi:hypothetical protein